MSTTPNRFLRLASGEIETASRGSSRTINFTFATSDVALDGHRILPGAWQSKGHDGLADFRKNPIFLWSHDTQEPPIGRVLNVSESGGKLRGTVKFATHEFAITIYGLFRDGFLRGASVSWQPLLWSYATGGNREPGAIDFSKVKLLEISGVTLPADTNALADASERGLIRPQFARKLLHPDGRVGPRIICFEGVIYNTKIPAELDAYAKALEEREFRRRKARARAVRGRSVLKHYAP